MHKVISDWLEEHCEQEGLPMDQTKKETGVQNSIRGGHESTDQGVLEGPFTEP